jgi:hypothetical protein
MPYGDSDTDRCDNLSEAVKPVKGEKRGVENFFIFFLMSGGRRDRKPEEGSLKSR